MKMLFKSLKNINYRMLAALILFGLLPTIYTTIRIFLIGQMPNEHSFSIAGQLQWVNILYEVIQEAFILPMFFFIGAVFSDKEALKNRVRTGLLLAFSIYVLLATIILIFAKPLVVFMAQDQSIIDETVKYIRLETVANIFSMLVKFIMVVLTTKKKDKNIYFVLICQLVLTIIFDVFFTSTLSVSLNLGVNGIAITNIIVNVGLLALSIYILHRNKINLFEKKKLDFRWTKELAQKGGFSGLESLVRNFCFMFMVVRMANVVGEQGTFWITNNFIWGWLLLPVIQLGELIKADIAAGKDKAIKNNSLGYFGITSVIVILWFTTLPGWEPFLSGVLQLENAKEIYFLALISIGFYILFAFNNVIDSVFYGIGKTNYLLFQSLAVNIIFYGIMFILFITGVWIPTLATIALMFAGGTACDSLLTIGMYVWFLKKYEINIISVEQNPLTKSAE